MKKFRWIQVFSFLAFLVPNVASGSGFCDSGIDWVKNNQFNTSNNPGYPLDGLYSLWQIGFASGCIDVTGDGSDDACKAIDQGTGWYEISCLLADTALRGSIIRSRDQRLFSTGGPRGAYFVKKSNGHPGFC